MAICSTYIKLKSIEIHYERQMSQTHRYGTIFMLIHNWKKCNKSDTGTVYITGSTGGTVPYGTGTNDPPSLCTYKVNFRN